MENLMGSSVTLKKPMREDREFLSGVSKQYHLLMRLINDEHGLRQLYLATEVYRYYKQSGVYDFIREDLIRTLKVLGLGDRIKKILALKEDEYEKLLRQQFMGLNLKERDIPLKTIQLYMASKPDRATVFNAVLTPRDRDLFSALKL
jgi:hypothetical protein